MDKYNSEIKYIRHKFKTRFFNTKCTIASIKGCHDIRTDQVAS